MDDLKQRMWVLHRELLQAAQKFAKAGWDPKVPPKRALLELQQRLDCLRQAIWDARKLCDPYLMPFPCEHEPDATPTLAERIVHVIDARKKTA